MSWASGSNLFSELAVILSSHVKDKAMRRKLYKAMIKAFEDFDCDTLDEANGIDSVLDELLYARYNDE